MLLQFILSLFKRPSTQSSPELPPVVNPVNTPIKPMPSNGITLKELLMNKYQLKDQSPEIQGNLMTLLERINKVRDAYGKPMIVTSGLRSMEDHKRIYAQKGITVIPMKSKHLYGQAVDISDPKQELQKWCLENTPVLEQIGLWMEDFSASKNWVHMQIVPPASGNRFFKP